MIGKVRVKMRTIMAGDHGTAYEGDVVEVPAHIAEELLRTRQAELPEPIVAPVSDDDEDEDEAGGWPAEETAVNPPDSQPGVEQATTGRKPRLRRG